MLKTILDFEIFEDFTSHQPKPIPLGREEENEEWLTFWMYLKSGSDVDIVNHQKQQNIFLTQLTTGRKGSKISMQVGFNKPHKNIFPKKQYARSVFFLDEEDNSEQNKYRKQNGYVFGFMNDYRKVWKDFSFLSKRKVLAVRKGAEIRFSSWEHLDEYIMPFTDLIFVDNYILNEKIWEYNLIRIIERFAKRTPVRFNLMIVSYKYFEKYEQNKAKYISEIYKKLIHILKREKINCDVSIILADNILKEHDRGIFTNYLWIQSGDSFNYFNETGIMKTKGTTINLHSMADRNSMKAAKEVLKKIKNVIDRLNNPRDKESRLKGKLRNRLLEKI